MAARLLVVDDHEIVRIGVRMLFTKNDSFEVCGEARDAVEAIRMVSDLSPDVVILDLSMPGMNGFEIATRIRLIAPSTKIILFSIHDIPTTARLAGADAFVSKSAPLEELAAAVTRVLHPEECEAHQTILRFRDEPRLEFDTAFSPARACENESVMPIEFPERRRQPRARLSQVVRIRPCNANFLPQNYTTSNVSRGGLYFTTLEGHYAPGVRVYVTGDFESGNPMGHTVAGVVVRVDKLENDTCGVAIRVFSPLSPTVH
jgi:DNA-binding NarL/FixJ family response regulator